MIGRSQYRNLLENTHRGNARTFAMDVLHLTGLVDESGRRYRDAAGNAALRDPDSGTPRAKVTEHSLRGLAEALLGEDACERVLRPDLLYSLRDVPEAGEGAIGPTAFANINAFTGVVAGLMEVSILEGWNAPEFIADTIAPAEPSTQFEGRKSIGLTRVGDQAEERQPGMPTKRVQIGERWITQPRTVENSLAAEVTQETVFLDQTGQANESGLDLGMWLGYRKELRVIDAFIGVTNTYNYKGTGYNTYITAGYYDNLMTGNDLLYVENVQAAEIKFRDMKDPDTGTRVLISPDTVVVNRERLAQATVLFGGSDTQYRSDPAAGGGARQTVITGPNPVKTRNYTLLESPLVFERMTAADGLNLSASAAGKTWFMTDRKGFMRYVQNWPLRVQTAAPNQLEMIDRGTIVYVKADERGAPMVKEPRKSLQSRG